MNKKMEKYLIAIEATNFKSEQKLYWNLKTIVYFEIMEKGLEIVLDELDSIFSLVKDTKKFKKTQKQWAEVPNILKVIQ